MKECCLPSQIPCWTGQLLWVTPAWTTWALKPSPTPAGGGGGSQKGWPWEVCRTPTLQLFGKRKGRKTTVLRLSTPPPSIEASPQFQQGLATKRPRGYYRGSLEEEIVLPGSLHRYDMFVEGRAIGYLAALVGSCRVCLLFGYPPKKKVVSYLVSIKKPTNTYKHTPAYRFFQNSSVRRTSAVPERLQRQRPVPCRR